MITAAQTATLHAALPEDWTPVGEVRDALLGLLSISPHDRAAGDGLLLMLTNAGVVEHRDNGRFYRRGKLPEQLGPLEQLKADENKRLNEMREEREEQLRRKERADAHALATLQAPEKARTFLWIDERNSEWATLLGFTADQIRSVKSQLSNPSIVPPLPAEPPQTRKHLPADAYVLAA